MLFDARTGVKHSDLVGKSAASTTAAAAAGGKTASGKPGEPGGGGAVKLKDVHITVRTLQVRRRALRVCALRVCGSRGRRERKGLKCTRVS